MWIETAGVKGRLGETLPWNDNFFGSNHVVCPVNMSAAGTKCYQSDLMSIWNIREG